jgi:hypothetical protein
MADYSKRILSKIFKDKNSKNCYLQVCRWVANNIVSDDNISKFCSYTIVKKYNEQMGVYEYTLEVYAKISQAEVKNHHCQICKETHGLFFMSEETNCNWCKVAAFDRRINDEIKKKQIYIKEKMTERESK